MTASSAGPHTEPRHAGACGRQARAHRPRARPRRHATTVATSSHRRSAPDEPGSALHEHEVAEVAPAVEVQEGVVDRACDEPPSTPRSEVSERRRSRAAAAGGALARSVRGGAARALREPEPMAATARSSGAPASQPTKTGDTQTTASSRHSTPRHAPGDQRPATPPATRSATAAASADPAASVGGRGVRRHARGAVGVDGDPRPPRPQSRAR